MKKPKTLKLIPIKSRDVGSELKNRPILYENKGHREIGVYSHIDNLGTHIQFAGNDSPMVINTGGIYLVEIKE